jgi:hypothetical protein
MGKRVDRPCRFANRGDAVTSCPHRPECQGCADVCPPADALATPNAIRADAPSRVAHAGLLARFERAVDPFGSMPAEARHRLAVQALAAHYRRMREQQRP